MFVVLVHTFNTEVLPAVWFVVQSVGTNKNYLHDHYVRMHRTCVLRLLHILKDVNFLVFPDSSLTLRLLLGWRDQHALNVE
jgi:hypothetical protein